MWRGRSGQDGGGEIGWEGGFAGVFEFGLRVVLGVFGERAGRAWLFFWLLMLA